MNAQRLHVVVVVVVVVAVVVSLHLGKLNIHLSTQTYHQLHSESVLPFTDLGVPLNDAAL